MVAIPDGTADTIVEAVRDVVDKKGIPVNRLYGLGTDGASVMTGNLHVIESKWKCVLVKNNFKSEISILKMNCNVI